MDGAPVDRYHLQTTRARGFYRDLTGAYVQRYQQRLPVAFPTVKFVRLGVHDQSAPNWGAQPWASYQIRKIAGCACAGNAGNVFPRRWPQRKPLVSNPGMHHGTCVTHVPWCISGSLIRSDGENVPGIPGACAPVILRILQEAHAHDASSGGISKQNWYLCSLHHEVF